MGRKVTRCSSQDMKALLLAPAGGKFLRPLDCYDEVYPGILLGDASTALSTLLLKELKVTHVVNAAYGRNDFYYGGYVNTSESYYEKVGIKFLGVPGLDTPSFYLRSYFREVADFIESALKKRGKVLVHCQCGISRSAALIAGYLMLKKDMDVQQALTTIRSQRSIFPNQGFLSQLCDFDYELRRAGTLPSQHSDAFYDPDMPVKDSLKKANHCDRFPYFSSTNYFPIHAPLSQGGYPITSAFKNWELERSRQRARSEERFPRSIYEREQSPVPTRYRTIRSASVIPEALLYHDHSHDYDSTAHTKPKSERSSNASSPHLLSSYDLTSRPYQNIYSYHTRTSPAPFYYTPKQWTKPITNTYRRSRELSSYTSPSLTRTLTPRDSTYTSSRPLESYSYTAPSFSRSFVNYTPMEETVYIVRSPRVYSRTYSETLPYTSTYVPSVLRYPHLGHTTMYTRVY